MNISTIPSLNNVRYKSARNSLLFIVILSIVNLFTTVLAQFYFVFSAWIPQQMITVGYFLTEQSGSAVWTWVFGIIGAILIVPYVLCLVFSKKHVGWMIGALVYFSLDSLVFLIGFVSLITSGDLSLITNLVFRIAALVLLALGVKYGIQLKKEQDAEAVPTAAQADAILGDETENAYSGVTRQITVARKKAFVGMAMPLPIYVNDQEVCRLKNGETKSFTAPAEAITLAAMFATGGAVGKTAVPAGDSNISYEVSIKSGMMANEILFRQTGTEF